MGPLTFRLSWVIASMIAFATSLAGCKDCPVCECPTCWEPPLETPMNLDNGVEQWVHLPVRITFPTSSPELDQQQQALLREVVSTLRSRSDVRRLRIEGHTDNEGTDEFNQTLSEQRAQTVLEHLVRLGVDRALLESVGYGRERPLTSNTTEMDRAQNRRVEFSVLIFVPAQ